MTETRSFYPFILPNWELKEKMKVEKMPGIGPAPGAVWLDHATFPAEGTVELIFFFFTPNSKAGRLNFLVANNWRIRQ